MYNNILQSLSNYMLIGDNLKVDFYNNKFKNQQKFQTTYQQNNRNDRNNSIYVIRQKDSLFWAFYILKYGLFSYEMSTCSQSFSVENQEKFKYIELIRQNKELLKLHKIQKINSLENELVNERMISIKTFISMCIIENINVCVINDRKMYMNILDETLPINIIFKNKNKPNYCIDFETNKNKINNYKEKYLIITSFNNKLKSINSYTLDELLEICKKMNLTISNEEKITKKYLYELLCKYY
jgi:hypothetical protein